MRVPVVLLAASLLGVIGGAWLIGRWAVGCAVIFDSLCLGALVLFRDDGASPQVHGVPGSGGTLQQVLERARDAS